MEKLRKELERIIDDTSSGIHNSQEWWSDEYANEDGTPIEGLISRIINATQKHFMSEVIDKFHRMDRKECCEGYRGEPVMEPNPFGDYVAVEDICEAFGIEETFDIHAKFEPKKERKKRKS